MRTKDRHSGIALILVIVVMAIAAVMAYAMLSAGALQEQVSANSIAQANADALAESGVSLAMYYLTHTSTAPVTPPYTESGLTFNSLSGSVTLTVSSPTQISTGPRTIADEYPITSTATSGGILRTITATAVVNLTFQSPEAVGCNTAMTVSSNVTINSNADSIVANGLVTNSGGVVNGTLNQTPSSPPSPTYAQVNSYATYTYNGQTCTAQSYSGNTSISSAPTANSTNPAGIFIYNGNLTVSGTINFTGTLIIGGNLVVSGNGANLTVTPAAADSQGHAFPAVIASGLLQLANRSQVATFNGLCMFPGSISGGALANGNAVTINGTLLLPTTSSIALPVSSFKGTVTINYSAADATVPDLTTSDVAPLNVKLSAWSD